MSRPQKIREDLTLSPKSFVWNKCCDAWKRWLPGVKELTDLLNEAHGIKYLKASSLKIDRTKADVIENNNRTAAKVIYKRLQG